MLLAYRFSKIAKADSVGLLSLFVGGKYDKVIET